MRRLRLSPKARADLDAICNYTVEQWSEQQAEAYLASLDQTMKLLCANPMLGADVSHVRQGYRKFPVASHVLFYQVGEDTLDIIRILHKRVDVERQL